MKARTWAQRLLLLVLLAILPIRNSRVSNTPRDLATFFVGREQKKKREQIGDYLNRKPNERETGKRNSTWHGSTNLKCIWGKTPRSHEWEPYPHMRGFGDPNKATAQKQKPKPKKKKTVAKKNVQWCSSDNCIRIIIIIYFLNYTFRLSSEGLEAGSICPYYATADESAL